MSEPLTLQMVDGVATVTIDKPPINAVSVDLMRDLADAHAIQLGIAGKPASPWWS